MRLRTLARRRGDGFRVSAAFGSDVFHLDDLNRAAKRWVSSLQGSPQRRFPSPTGP
ncbi:hypothetical protein MICRO8M_60140 [Microbacterium sp. 8M]|nr:hypothetical protein MICRO8M_60140 [Microbacterium sp. 8M]